MERGEKPSRLDGFLDRPRRAIWVVALPMMAAFSAQALYMIVDQVFIGRLGPLALAASTFVGSLFFGVMAINIGFTTGVTAVVAQAVGRRDKEGADRTAANALFTGLCLGVAVSGFGWVFGRQVIPWLGAKGETVTLAWQYFQILCVGMLFMFLSGAIRATLTGEGDSRTPMIVAIVSTLINVCFDPVFMFVLGWGIRGAACATVLSQLFTLVSYSYIAFRKRGSYVTFRLGRAYLRPRQSLMAPIARIGLPAAAGQIVMSLGSVCYNRIVSEFGQTAVAGYGAASKIDLIVSLPIVALSSAVLSIVGMFGGANRTDLIRSIVLYTFRSVMVITVVIGLIAFFASTWIVGLFTKDPHALAVGHTYLRYIVFAYPLMAFGITAGRILQGLGQGIPPLVITTLRVLLIGVPASYVAVVVYGAPIQSIWLSIIAGSLIADILAFIWIRYFIWQRKPVLSTPSTPPEIP